MLNSNKHGEIAKHHSSISTGLAVAAGAVILDQLWGAYDNSRRRNHPEFHTAHLKKGQQTLGVLPGCQTNGEMLFKELKSITPGVKLVSTDYPERGFDIEEICEEFGKELINARAERVSILCQSMGGMVARHFLPYAHEMGVAEKLGGFGTIIFDSSPFHFSDVREHSKELLQTASMPGIRTSHVLDIVKPHIYRRIAGPMSAGAHLDTIRWEGMFMKKPHPDSSLPDIMDQVWYAHGPNDHVVDTQSAIKKYEAITPQGKFHEFFDASRADGSHTADANQMRFLLQEAGVLYSPLRFAA